MFINRAGSIASNFSFSILFLAVIFFFTPDIFAEGLSHESNEAWRKALELKYGYSISIKKEVLESESFYLPASGLDTPEKRETQILNDIETAFSMLPEGFVQEVNKIYHDRGYSPEIIIRERQALDGAGFIAHWLLMSGPVKKAEIHMYDFGEIFVDTLLHEFAHQLEDAASFKNPGAVRNLRLIFESQNGDMEYSEDIYERADEVDYSESFVSLYSLTDFSEDFAELFSDSLTRPDDINELGGGERLPLHIKIRALGILLEKEFTSLGDENFLVGMF